ncbi:MAG: NADH-quinone oxidoreductase subunit NuoE [Chloroflexia bacterium]|nr:NADH-quinone oxidoreductase subunit NuoE [Chloroflexia bacterium]
MTAVDTMHTRVNEIIDTCGENRANSLLVLQEIQHEYNYLPRTALEQVADRMEIPLSEVYHLATFYRHFSLSPKGDFCLRVCMGTACHVHGAPRILEAFERELGIKAGESTADGTYSLEATGCLGACAQAPIMMVNEEAHPQITAADVPDVLEQCQCALPEQ